MAMTEAATQSRDQPGRSGRRRPFSALMKKLANLKAGSDNRYSTSKRSATKKPLNNPYPQSGFINVDHQPRYSRSSVSTGPSSLSRADSTRRYSDDLPPPATGARSVAPTVSTDHDAGRSIITSHGDASLAGTSRTTNGRRGADSTFSSPAPSVRSLATTLTTVQTAAPNLGGGHAHHHSHASNSQTIHFNQPFPTGPPASAIPAHLTGSQSPSGHLTTYATATANNLLTDNASILTLASSSKRRRRRHSLDTDASVRALAPSSLWGGSRESLPLSVLSATMEGSQAPPPPGTPGGGAGLRSAGSANGISTERASIYSATGILGTAAVGAGERASLYGPGPASAAGKAALAGGVGGDGASVRSGLLGHGRTDSANGSIGGPAAVMAGGTPSPLASPREEVKGKEVGREEE
ncbi:hypothetical protein VTJ04DRAFT_9324 [Mycothermus thermophilus]|uniref:uncharacterized protein n=1 Tax=Humicola insolens TaxID=85995 RepID=UPI003742CDC2